MEKHITKEHGKKIEEYRKKAIELEKAEQVLSKLSEVEYKENHENEFKNEMRSLETQYQSKKLKFNQGWAFLNHMGIVKPFTTNNSRLVVLNESNIEFRGLLRFLDVDCHLRMSMKIGIVYVGKGQFEQKDIFFNSKGSENYEEFLKNIGKVPTRPEVIKIYKKQPNILYYVNSNYEIIFHVITRMPTKVNDPQQLEKKKHIGNDSIHIIWNENERVYRPGTITGAFNFVHVILHPLRNGLYSVSVKKKKGDAKNEWVKFFGPLITGMILPMSILTVLLRYTVINARKSIVFNKLQLYNPLGERKRTLEKLISKYAIGFEHDNEGDENSFLDKLIRSNTE